MARGVLQAKVKPNSHGLGVRVPVREHLPVRLHLLELYRLNRLAVDECRSNWSWRSCMRSELRTRRSCRAFALSSTIGEAGAAERGDEPDSSDVASHPSSRDTVFRRRFLEQLAGAFGGYGMSMSCTLFSACTTMS